MKTKSVMPGRQLASRRERVLDDAHRLRDSAVPEFGLQQPLGEKLAVEEQEGVGLAGERLIAGADKLLTRTSLDLVKKSMEHVLCDSFVPSSATLLALMCFARRLCYVSSD